MENSVIQVSHLVKNYRTGNGLLEVLKGIDLDIKAGEIIGYLGSNGAGKSTTVKILCGILSDFDGDVNILGHDVKKESMQIKHKIGYIPENAIIYEHLTPTEYLEFIGSLYGLSIEQMRKKIQQMLTLFEMHEYAHTRMTTFSKGMKQKIHIISGLLHNPDILFMDEPLNGLDANAVIMIKEMITQLAHDGKTIFYCSHLMDVVEKIATRIILIDNGIVIANDHLAALQKKNATHSLEELFSKLTHKENSTENAEQLVNTLETLAQ